MAATSWHGLRMAKEIEEGGELRIDFTKLSKIAGAGCDVVPAVAQDASTGAVLIVGYANREALETTLRVGKATFWSTSRNELWIKGNTSGDFLEIVEVRVNCEQNSLLYLVNLAGKGACHTRGRNGASRHGCYYRRIEPDGSLSFVEGME